MPSSTRNPLSVSHVLEKVGDVVQNAKENLHSQKSSLAKKMGEEGLFVPYVDLHIQFIRASGIPKLDLVGSTDPYFVAKLDDHLSFVSSVKHDAPAPVWNESWRVKNVPATANLVIKLIDKGVVTDVFIGTVKTSVSTGEKKCEIDGPAISLRKRGTFWMKIESTRAVDEDPSKFPYLFDGPIRYSRHFSPTIGALTNLNKARLYSTWKVYLKGVPLFFGDIYQPWSRNYAAARDIFQGPTSVVVRSGIQAGHHMLYARTPSNGFGVIEDKAEILRILQGGESRQGPTESQFMNRVKPAVYTYIISSEDDSLRFSETGAAFFVDFVSKHALHSNCYETVRYSGEFHPRPEGGWDKFCDDTPDEAVNWELVIDNNSGTYAPDKAMLPALKRLLEHNLPGFKIYALDHGDEELKKSREACRQYALKFRDVKQDELQPHAQAGEETLSHRAEATLQHAEHSLAEVRHSTE